MATPIKDFLESCRLSHLLPKFEEQNIDELEILKELSQDQISFLAPNIGDKIKLERGLARLNESEHQAEEPPKKIQKCNEETIINTTSNQVLNETNDQAYSILFVEDLLPSVTTPAPVTPKDIIEDSISLATTETISCSSQAASSSTSVERENTFQKTSIGNFDLIDFLKNDLLGDAILYKSTKFKLDNTDRDRLCEILIKHLIHHYGKLNAEDFLVLSKKIVNAFPRELCSTYILRGCYSKNPFHQT
ncbi:uncharacterized protein LOC115890156 [Sitophilus oryzae]|uniref:Uncharacterized protein LOC115890156 n=1 Tax=Sitophilus oryzae TaxID=7048 RepID=A0A6J2YSF2_SITOR|nr:uncharacterized protein LOC115890156 [Sitophilus oryzae]